MPTFGGGPAEAWKRCLTVLKHEKTQELMSHYYGNLGLMSALLIAITFTVMLELDDTDPWQTEAAVAGVISFALLLGCVVEAVLIDNGVTKCATEQDLRSYVTEHPFYLAWPTYLFTLGLLFGLFEFFLWICSRFSTSFAIFVLVGGIVFLSVMAWRFVEQSNFFAKIEKAALPGVGAPTLH